MRRRSVCESMSGATPQTLSASLDPGLAPESSELPPSQPTFAQRIIRQAFAGIGARLGLTWIGLLILLAIFAPVLASTHPLLMKMEGQWSSPWFEHLTPLDLTLFAVVPVAVVLYIIR